MHVIARTKLAYAALACTAVVVFSGCESRSYQTRQVSIDDKRIASETIELVKLQAASNGDLSRRTLDCHTLSGNGCDCFYTLVGQLVISIPE